MILAKLSKNAYFYLYIN